MRVLIFYLMKKINAARLSDILLVLLGIFVVLVAIIYLFFLRAEHVLYNGQVEIMQNLVVQRANLVTQLQMAAYDKVPKQSLMPRSIQDLQTDLVSVIGKGGIEHYDLKLEGSEVLSNQCCYKFGMAAKAKFKNILKFLRALNKESFLLKKFTINNPSENGLDFYVVLSGFCGDFCACKK